MAKKVADAEIPPPPPQEPDAPTSPVAPETVPSTIPAQTVREAVRAMEAGWIAFRDAAGRFPGERMDEHLTEDGWTRKQMLAHISAWHDLTTDRLGKFTISGKPVALDGDEDAINARVARQAIGKTAGEVLKDMEATFNKLRRRMLGMTDQQLAAHDAWAASIVAGNTYDHYAEHMADVYMPEPTDGKGRRR